MKKKLEEQKKKNLKLKLIVEKLEKLTGKKVKLKEEEELEEDVEMSTDQILKSPQDVQKLSQKKINVRVNDGNNGSNNGSSSTSSSSSMSSSSY